MTHLYAQDKHFRTKSINNRKREEGGYVGIKGETTGGADFDSI